MRCSHFDAGTCSSCTLLPVPRDRQVAEGRARVESLLAPYTATAPAPMAWESPVVGPDSRFRARARMAVSGTTMDPVLGLPGERARADLSDCPLHPEPVEALLDAVKALMRRAQVPPYDVARRRGELKNVLVTCSASGTMMLQLVLRSENALPRIREHLPTLLAAQPDVVSVSANIHPDHTALLTGERDIHLAGSETLPMPTGDVVLHARPGSFVQTNTASAGELYRTAARWAHEALAQGRACRSTGPLRVWDLYCGLGGFALHIARSASSPVEITGVEVSADAIAGARESAADESIAGESVAGESLVAEPATGPVTDLLSRAAPSGPATCGAGSDRGTTGSRAPAQLEFVVDDAAAWAQRTAAQAGPPDLLVVNPPRRGIGAELADWIEPTPIRHVVYSSCNPTTLAADLQRMPSLRIVRGRYVDMFPHTAHAEVVVLLERIVSMPPRPASLPGDARKEPR